ncbi:hypothetical protein N7499_005753 [Penicillium canescens]|uniref:Cyanovirin-N domain-containing protein n=1 Tax=Penicillium canescens TaxID=5083 RepID=A0AAD6ICH9_PENCN|nr:uncharacterized protein N7446_001522 [Penicillium canescens]KAJ5997853.1 hypothetical protein N7522_009513 [Penicillium canescens]KAJ6043327.1 hypothetical protein N7460_004682 [Penicillium canescens]KAJ6054801.1 hypothetical protein N7444_003899 [Penicillium canescens]KAJ6073745.1 hypothetical protein N7446_001522 [Penicillium canescens]KAJ6080879.1 hypothetical protein N7499_005753 [Penicillium canescens]
MPFHKSSMNIRLKDKHILTAYCRRPTGDALYSELDLNPFLGAKKGKLTWSCENFSDSATDVALRMDGPDNEPILQARLDDGEGNICSDELNLSSCIKNEDGHLRYMQCF